MPKPKKQAQQELPGMPDPTPAGRYAIKFLEIKDEIEKKREELSDTGKKLIEALNQEGKATIKIGHRIISTKYVEAAVKIQVSEG
jgi:hypothetical protein